MDHKTDDASANKPTTTSEIFITNEEILTVIVNEGSSNSPSNCQIELSESMKSDNDANENLSASGAMNIDDQSVGLEDNKDESKTTPKSILANADADKVRSLLRKKSVSFENDEDVKKFVSGEIIVDKRNPFRFATDNDYREESFTEVNNVTHVPKASVEEDDYISKEDILKQSKYVPVYIRNPDRVFTYDKSILEKLAIKSPVNKSPPTAEAPVKRAPVPIPRKTIKEAHKAKAQVRHSTNHVKYPDIKEIKVRLHVELIVVRRFFSNLN